MRTFAFQLQESVAIAVSGERGTIVGRAEYTNQSPQYLIRYKTADGRAIESWWAQDALALFVESETAFDPFNETTPDDDDRYL